VVIEEHWTTSGGARIRYLDNRPQAASGLPILFSPGVTDFADEYLAMLEFMAPRRVVVAEVRGRGRSDAPPAGYAVTDQADDLEAVVHHAGIERLHLMTFSRGTSSGLTLALRDPGRVASVSIGDYLAVELAMPPEWPEHHWSMRWRGRPMPERVGLHVLRGIQRASIARQLWADVAALGVPVLVARGSEGGLVTDRAEARYREAMPWVEVVTVEGAGHDLFRPDRLRYPSFIADFLARNFPRESEGNPQPRLQR
jgi:pimeloyl-ACP methyl ester carboxylesterase